MSLLALVAACASTETNTPTPREIRDATPPTVASTEALLLRLDLDAWSEKLPQGLAPVWVELENRGDAVLLVRYGAFSLVGAGGRGPMPAQQLADAAAVEAVESNLAPIGRVEEGEGNEARILQGSGPTDPSSDVQGGIGDRAPAIDDFQHNYWDRFGPPTEDMYERALRETELAPGEAASGYLYFPRQELDTARAFAVELATAGGTSSVEVEASLR